MSNNESFIDEVTEEVRKDRLYGYARRFGWIAVLAVLGIVGGTAYTEWKGARDRAQAQAFGDGVLGALDLGAPEDRAAALAGLPAVGDRAAILGLMRASDPEADPAVALQALDAVAAIPDLRPKYRDLAILRRTIVAGPATSIADRRSALDGIALPGAPYRVLALEQLALLLVEEGRGDEAIAAFQALGDDQQASQGLRTRADQMIVALGGEVALRTGGLDPNAPDGTGGGQLPDATSGGQLPAGG